MKYIILVDETRARTPFFTAGMVSHAQLARMLTFAMPAAKVVSAGFIELTTCEDGRVHARTFGRSESLGLGPGFDDADIISCLCTAALHSARHLETIPSKPCLAATAFK